MVKKTGLPERKSEITEPYLNGNYVEMEMKKESEVLKSKNKYQTIVAISKEARKLNERKRHTEHEKITTTALRYVVDGEVEIRFGKTDEEEKPE